MNTVTVKLPSIVCIYETEVVHGKLSLCLATFGVITDESLAVSYL